MTRLRVAYLKVIGADDGDLTAVGGKTAKAADEVLHIVVVPGDDDLPGHNPAAVLWWGSGAHPQRLPTCLLVELAQVWSATVIWLKKPCMGTSMLS